MSPQYTNFYPKTAGLFNKSSPPMVMGILNITDDSFYDGGKYKLEGAYKEKCASLLEEGADIIDIGAQSTRPGAILLSEKEEEDNLIKAIVQIRNAFPDIVISADTFRANIAQKAIEAGANIINDVSGGTMDKNMFSIVGHYNIPYVLMHIQGTPRDMQKKPVYQNVTHEVISFLKKQIELLDQKGANQIIIDPGFGFGKTLDHNYQLLNELEAFSCLSQPVLVGVSRKSMIWKLLDNSPDEALNGTTAANTIALLKGAKILRVHDVKEAKEAITIVAKLSIIENRSSPGRTS